jgi:hypothetical protein
MCGHTQHKAITTQAPQGTIDVLEMFKVVKSWRWQ